MPGRNTKRVEKVGGYYHIYNMGVEKRKIFQDQEDYSVFLTYLKEHLTPKDEITLRAKFEHRLTTPAEKDKILKTLRMNNFAGEITLLVYCLMPNHFHFLVKQKSAGAMDKFMNSLGTRYTMYFNKKYKRVGPLYQGAYKAVLVETAEQLLHLSRYIHKQALSIPSVIGSGQPCSYPAYTGSQSVEWVNPEEVLSFFSQSNPRGSYQSFVGQEDELDFIYKLTLEE